MGRLDLEVGKSRWRLLEMKWVIISVGEYVFPDNTWCLHA